MKKIKRITSALLAVCLLLSGSSISVHAATSTEFEYIESLREEMHADIREQLIAQDALDQYELFVAIFDEDFNQKYYPNPISLPASVAASAPSQFTARNGGWLHAYNSDIDITCSYLTADDAKNDYDDMMASTELSAGENLGKTVIGFFLDVAESIVDFLVAGSILIKESTWSTINVGTDNALVVSSCDKVDYNTTVVVSKWRNYPTITNNLSYYGNVTYGTK